MKSVLGKLYIVSTPIGNLDDITLRAIETLKNSDVILCEDTRRSVKLLNFLKVKKKLVSYHKFNEKKHIPNIIEQLNRGKSLSLISDAGTPLLSDPGKSLIEACIKNKIKIVPIPGPSAITTSVSVSGFSDRFLFYGFLPKTENELEKCLDLLSENTFSLVFFVTSVKINFYLKKFKKYFKGRKILIARELTKLYEAFYRSEVDKIKLFKNDIKGELTVVISEKNTKDKVFDSKKIKKKAKIFLKKYSLKDTVDLIFETEKKNKKDIYKICLDIQDEKNY